MVRAVRTAQSTSADEAARLLADPGGFDAFAAATDLDTGLGRAALRRALEVRSGRPTARVSSPPDAPRYPCDVCGGLHPAVWRASDRAWVRQKCDRRAWTLDFAPPAEMSRHALEAAIGRLRRIAWAYQDVIPPDAESIRRVLAALEARERSLVAILHALRAQGAPEPLIAALRSETWLPEEKTA